MSRKPTKAELLRAMNAIHACLERLKQSAASNAVVWETIGGITYWVEETLDIKVKALPGVPQ